jgi:hypothetical protein
MFVAELRHYEKTNEYIPPLRFDIISPEIISFYSLYKKSDDNF